MNVSKWILDFKPNQDASLAPIWVNFLGLPLPLFNMKYLEKLGTLIGRPLQVDSATLDFKSPSVARILVEVNVMAIPIKRLWIGDMAFGMWQPVEYENWPEYCSFCKRLGHDT